MYFDDDDDVQLHFFLKAKKKKKNWKMTSAGSVFRFWLNHLLKTQLLLSAARTAGQLSLRTDVNLESV